MHIIKQIEIRNNIWKGFLCILFVQSVYVFNVYIYQQIIVVLEYLLPLHHPLLLRYNYLIYPFSGFRHRLLRLQ